ncbi:THUMP domain-containing class I SAM-dependent RNA methyltransferase [Roseibaca sp. Y0-43]|uniref:THUMP domain-containing class I SAM-dependent RNA methyltransferase n=1 Tax=Roseibaca sp. Y0-43 TaxID=2816854 RepID=UPI001D0CBD7E|nr:class I SAM-dependent RNA methyltransferase [Roseibaca sp. Y0-43]MCC1482452.1 class I SAM-dependent RNA methyltransferase [Roseibaca sp. Y0-43]
MDDYTIFMACLPGFEPLLLAEAQELGLRGAKALAGGVEVSGGMAELARANRESRIASRVLLRIGEFRALHLAQLDKRARKLPWADWLRADVPVRVEASCTKSRIYHQKAAAQRIERAIADLVGAPISADGLRVMLRIDDDLATISLDTSGEGLHKRGFKQFTGKAPLRETMAAAFLRQMGYDGSQAVLDPMCGSGTFVLEAAEIAAGLAPGRARGFAFEQFAAARDLPPQPAPNRVPERRYFGFDRDQGAIQGARANAERAGLCDWTSFTCQPVSALTRPDCAPGLVMVNPPYGGRIGNIGQLYGLYASLGKVLAEQFQGWRVGLVTTEAKLAHTTGLKLEAGAPIPHGGMKVRLFQSGAL